MILDTMTGDRNHYICHVYYEDFVSAIDVEDHCTTTRDGSAVTVTLR